MALELLKYKYTKCEVHFQEYGYKISERMTVFNPLRDNAGCLKI